MSLRPEISQEVPFVYGCASHPCFYDLPLNSSNLPLIYLISLQNQALQQIVDQNSQIALLINKVSARSVPASKPREIQSQNFSESRPHQQEEDFRRLKIVQDHELSAPILKERGFALTGSVRDGGNSPAKQAAGTRLSISLYAEDTPNRPLTVNIAGKKILRGTITTEVKEDGSFVFENIVINEVSSHYIDDAFTLVVNDEAGEMKPLTYRRVTVRARKAKALEGA